MAQSLPTPPSNHCHRTWHSHSARVPSRWRRHQPLRRHTQWSAIAQAQPTFVKDKEVQLRNLCLEYPVDWPDCPGGVMVVRPLSLDWHGRVTELLTDAFVETSHFAAYRVFLRQRIRSYLEAQAKLIPRTVILMATLRQTTASEDNDQPPTSNPEQPAQAAPSQDSLSATGATSEVLLGTVEVSWDRATHSSHLLLNPPTKSAYLCNMAVSKSWRRRGVGQRLIQSVEEACRISQEDSLYLHLRVKDEGPAALYQTVGFQLYREDPWVVKLLGFEPKKLMMKKVPLCKEAP